MLYQADNTIQYHQGLQIRSSETPAELDYIVQHECNADHVVDDFLGSYLQIG